MKIVFINVPWMKYYMGEGDEEKLVPACGYNFQYVNGYYYGYGDGLDNIALEQIDEMASGDNQIDDVTVIWTAKNKEGQNKIIGWYKKATIYREMKNELSMDSERLFFKYSIVAPADSAVLLPVELRLLDAREVPEGLYFEKDEKVIADVAMYIHNYAGDQMNYLFPKKDLEGASILNFPEYEMYFAKADEFLAKDLYGKAVRCFNKAIALEPELAIGYECKGSIFLSLKMYNEALEIYKKVIELEPENENAHYCLGLIYGLTGEYGKCIEEIGFYLNSRRDDMNAVAERGIAYYHLGQIEIASNAFKEAYTIEPENPIFKQLVEYIQS